MENWKDIPGYEGRYQISDLGRVKSIRPGWGTSILKPRDYFGYLIVELRGKPHHIHRLVA